MNEVVHGQAPKPARAVWVGFKRILALIVVLIAMIGFVANACGVVGVWVARRPARDVVTRLSTFVNRQLGVVQQALSRISARSDESRQALARVNSVTSKLGDRVDQGSPLLTELVNATRDELGPKIAETRAQAAVLRDGVMSVNAALETLDTLGFITLQELRVAIDEARTTASANLVAAVTSRTTKIDNGLAQIKSAAIKFQVAVEQKQQQVADLSRTVLLATNLLAISLTALFLAGAAGQVVLISVCWQYVRSGRFTLVRVA
jgi:uncharacterized protein YukE